MHLVHCAAIDLDLRGTAVENVTAALPILRQKMEMVSGDAKRCRERRRPYSHEGSTQLLESKFLLNGRGLFKPRSFRNRLHDSGLDIVEVSAHAKGIENVIRVAELVADLNQVVKGGYPLMVLS